MSHYGRIVASLSLFFRLAEQSSNRYRFSSMNTPRTQRDMILPGISPARIFIYKNSPFLRPFDTVCQVRLTRISIDNGVERHEYLHTHQQHNQRSVTNR